MRAGGAGGRGVGERGAPTGAATTQTVAAEPRKKPPPQTLAAVTLADSIRASGKTPSQLPASALEAAGKTAAHAPA